MKRCPRCRSPLPCQATGRRRKYCSPACRQAAYRKRRKRSVHFSSRSSEWATPSDFFARLDAQHRFTLDCCATAANAKCPAFFDRQADGLRQRWTGRVWMNPPYGREIGRWMTKAWQSVQSGDAELVVCLVPSRTGIGGGQASAPFDSALVVFRNAKARYETALAG
jgi:hypothetical protein